MLTPITDLPDNVIGFRASGELHADDYKNVLVPAIEEQLARGNDIRMVLVFERWEGVTGGAAWQDIKAGLQHVSRWKRIALVTDLDWIISLTYIFGWMTPGELRRFPLAERDAAIAWAAET